MQPDWIPRLRLGRPSGRTALVTVAAAGILLAGLAAVRREQIAFAARCWGNGNTLSACECVYNALVGKVYDTRLAAADMLETLTAVTVEVATDAATAAGKATAETGATTTVRAWRWVRSWF